MFMVNFEAIAEEKIKAAMQAGVFDHLAGKGRPLILEDDTQAPPEWRLAYHLLQNNHLSLPWLQDAQDIRRAWQAARQALLRDWRTAPSQNERQQAQRRFTEQVIKLNRRIMDYNLRVPAACFQIYPYATQLDISSELVDEG
jgi:hypothetical protein